MGGTYPLSLWGAANSVATQSYRYVLLGSLLETRILSDAAGGTERGLQQFGLPMPTL